MEKYSTKIQITVHFKMISVVGYSMKGYKSRGCLDQRCQYADKDLAN